MNLDSLTNKYRGDIVEKYNKRREKSPKWQNENEHVETLLSGFSGASVVDMPVGTGRFIPFYARNGNSLVGLDVSPDMVAYAQGEAERQGLTNSRFAVADATSLDPAQFRAEVAVCIRFMNWLDPQNARLALRNLSLMAERALVLGIRTVRPETLDKERRKRVEQRRKGATRPRADGKPHNHLHLRSDFEAWCEEFGLKVDNQLRVEVTEIGGEYDIHLLLPAG